MLIALLWFASYLAASADKSICYTLVVDAVTTNCGDVTKIPKKERRFTVRLCCEPRLCTLDDYRAAVQLLRLRIRRGPDIDIARMSATG